MKIKRFRAEGVHGYLQLDVSFFDDLTFLTGINGSGKTTVVYSIVALISPNPYILANIEFQNMRLEVEQGGRSVEIRAQRQQTNISLSVSDMKDPFTFPQFVPDPDEPAYRQSDREVEFYRELTITHADNPALKYINALPTPMFLDLDRRARVPGDVMRRGGYARPTRRSRNLFNVSLVQSLQDASQLAESNYSQLQARLRQITDQSRRELILSLLTLEPTTNLGGALEAPKGKDIQILDTIRKSAATRLPQLLQLPIEDITRRLNPFLDQMEKYFKAIPQNRPVGAILQSAREKPEEFNAVVGWSSNRPQLNKISKMMDYVTTFNAESEVASSPITNYLNLVNRFLYDSGKRLFFDELGTLLFHIEGLNGARSVSALSSGEAQIFVILTHLAFNPAAREANVFIVDEPELSLHVQWQELFVESVQAANPDVQYIMATHAPSVILSRIDNCINMNAHKVQDGSVSNSRN